MKSSFLKRKNALETFDTFLWRMSGVTGKKFHIQGLGTGEGGHLNYVGIGILLARFYGEGAYFLAPPAVAAWNTKQNFDNKTFRNFKDIIPGTRFAKRGIDLYLNWKGKRGKK